MVEERKQVTIMRFSTHSQTIPSKVPKLLVTMFCVGVGLMYAIFLLGAFACFYHAKNVFGGILVILIPIALTTWYCITTRDICKAYIEINGNEIRVVDYYLGIKKERMVLFSDITSTEIALGYSHRVKGYRFSAMGTRYIVLKKDNKYLFKIIYLPETENIFKDFLV